MDKNLDSLLSSFEGFSITKPEKKTVDIDIDFVIKCQAKKFDEANEELISEF